MQYIYGTTGSTVEELCEKTLLEKEVPALSLELVVPVWHSSMPQFHGTVVYEMVEKGGRVPPAACLVLPSLSLLLAAKLLFIIF